MQVVTATNINALVVPDGFVRSGGPLVPFTDQNYTWAGGDTLNPLFLPHSTLIRTECADRTNTVDPAMTVSFTTNVTLGDPNTGATVRICVYGDFSTVSNTWLDTRWFRFTGLAQPDLLDQNGALVSFVFEHCKDFTSGTSGTVDLGPALAAPPNPPRIMYFVP